MSQSLTSQRRMSAAELVPLPILCETCLHFSHRSMESRRQKNKNKKRKKNKQEKQKSFQRLSCHRTMACITENSFQRLPPPDFPRGKGGGENRNKDNNRDRDRVKNTPPPPPSRVPPPLSPAGVWGRQPPDASWYDGTNQCLDSRVGCNRPRGGALQQAKGRDA